MRRREFIAGLLLAPTMQRAEAQQSAKSYRIAVVHQSASVAEMSETADNPYYRALFKELRRLGHAEGKNLVVERYSGGGQEEFTELARDVVRTKPDVIVASSSRVVLSFKAATDTIPIVSSLADPVAYGIAGSIAHPGGNITGVSVDAGLDIWSKRLQLLREAIPTLSRVGYLGPQQSWHLPQVRTLEDTARQLQLSFLGPPLESPIEEAEYRRVLDAMTQERTVLLSAINWST